MSIMNPNKLFNSMKGRVNMEYDQIVKSNGVLGRVVTGDNKFYFHPAEKRGNYSCSQLDRITEETVEPITFEEKIQCIEQEFHWGSVIKTHDIGEYQIIEYIGNKGLVCFSPYVNFKCCHTSYTSLDIALIGVITGNSLEVNDARYATTCILRILKKPEW